MENISHSVVGLALGEVVHRSLAQESSQDQNKLRRNLFVFITLLSANFPDIDIVLTNLLPAPLGYLLHHRGHTHTFFYLLPQMLFLGLLIPIVWKSARKLLTESRTALFGYLICLVLGFLSHIGLDSLNSYGIHPFHPFDNNWYYGDLVFIIEPIFWIFIGVPLLSSFRNKWIKYSWATFLYIVPVALSIFGYLSLTWVSLALLLSSLVLVFQTKFHRPYGFLLSFSMCIGFILMQHDGQSRAQTLYEQQIMHKQSVNLELALNPMPTQNQCWMFVAVDKIADTIQTTRGVLTLGPSIVKCPSAFVKMSPVLTSSRRFKLYSVDSVETTHLNSLYQNNCFFRAWMKFARTPIIQKSRAWDGRFQRGTTVENFSLINLDDLSSFECPTNIPPWEMPRRDLLI